ncbi:MAG TPA: site-specific integrase [Terriglobales bacterium]|nr:site-specific integrase [Terriglobales bacterium]
MNGERMWEFRFYETDSQGERQRRAVTVGSLSEFPTESAARKSPVVQALLLRINAERPQAGSAPPSFGAVIARYEQEEMPERYSTSSAYKSNIKNYIRPRWADTPINVVKPMPVEDWLKSLKLAPKTRGNIRSLMHTIFDCAERWELVDKNPIKLVRVKGASKRQTTPRVLRPEQFCLLPPLIVEPYRTQVWIAGCLGLRPSEIMPLQWDDFDFEDMKPLIQRSIVHGREDDVKTEYSRDYVPLDPALVGILLEHRERCYPTPEGWLFANPATGRPYHQDTIQQNHIREAGKKAGLGDGIGWKTFRHSYRSWMDDTGAPLTVQKELMRHASIQTTMNVYGKAMTDTKRHAHSKVVEMILKPKKTEETADPQNPVAAIGS